MSAFQDRLRPAESYLEVLAKQYPLLRIGGRVSYGIIALELPGPVWKSAFQVLASKATAIIAIPGLSEALLSELAEIVLDYPLRSKTLIFQPPGLPSDWSKEELISVKARGGGLFWYYDLNRGPTSSRDREWRAVVAACARSAVELPPYNPEGQIITLGLLPPETATHAMSELKTLVDQFDKGASLYDAMNELERAVHIVLRARPLVKFDSQDEWSQSV